MTTARRAGLLIGPLGFAALMAVAQWGHPWQVGLNGSAVRVAAAAFLMATWWVTEAIPIPATSLLPLVLFPVFEVLSRSAAAAPYADRFIMLLMGGFFVALGLERWGLHRRLALRMVLVVGTRPRRLVLGFMLACAVTSMFISNTATTLMMLPLAAAVLQRVDERTPDDARVRAFGVALMLGIAYACNVGGIGSPIGTPPNLIFLAHYKKAFGAGAEISFLAWMRFALPIVAVMLAVVWLVLTRLVNRVPADLELGNRDALRAELAAMGTMGSAERRVLAVFAATAALWMTRVPVDLGGIRLGGWAAALGLQDFVDDGTVAIAAALAMFLVPAGPAGPRERLLDWETARNIPWGLLLLFGGGLSLASAFEVTGLSYWIGDRLRGLAGLPTWLVTGSICLAVTFLTEITSNTATTTVLMPVLASLCISTGLDPRAVMLPAALSASFAFMLPVATAPNAIVFGSDRVRMTDMVRCGLAINLAGVVVITLLV